MESRQSNVQVEKSEQSTHSLHTVHTKDNLKQNPPPTHKEKRVAPSLFLSSFF